MVRLPAINEPFSGLQKRAEVQQIRGANDFRFIKVHQALFCHASTSLQSSLPCWPPFANPNEAGAEMPTSSGSSSAAGVGIIFTQPDYLAWQKKKYISPKYKSITAQNDQFSPNNGKAILFFFFFLSCHICTTSPNPQTWHQAALSASCRTLLTPKNLQKFQFSAHKGILNSLHTPSQEVLPFQNLSQDYSGKIKTFSGIRGH